MKNLKKTQKDEWLLTIKEKPDEGLKLVYTEYQKEFINWLKTNYNCAEEEAHDLFQETIIILYKNIVSGRLSHLSSSLKTYLFSIGKNLALKSNLKLQRKNIDLVDLDIGAISELVSEENLYMKVLKEEELEGRKKEMLEGLKKLNNPCRTILLSYYVERLSLSEIAEKMGYNSYGVVKTQKYRCIKHFIKLFK